MQIDNKKMAALCDVFVMDAFATAHRVQASTVGVAQFAPHACAGPLLLKELEVLSSALDKPERTAVAYLADKEEIGSVGATGMDSIYFYHALSKIATLINPGISEVNIRELLHISNALSTDVEAAINPLFKEVHEANNAAKFGYGAAFSKYTGARGKGGSNDADAEYVAKLRKLLDDEKIPYQIAELGKVDEGGGGTVAYLLARYGIHTIDMGVALLSMHSPWEIASKVDLYAVCEACKHFLQKM